ncbi:hypothetical protein [Bradyrhizobium sp. AS23.2]|uniref:hypothetical protein n=1 Tax=Bradyrhizobium sp. AS23.2 TaxID=1680155 RepID=UPI00093BB9B1|nr:hypothetical protein [Bradyrhizobium sp. AS23.2]OKO85378.1 hypothetical protein AC630_06015 [Bradyrhizobium sp. AS23.2]
MKTWSQELVDRYPEVLVRKLRGVPFAAGYPQCNTGWRDIVTNLVARVSAAAVGYSVQLTEIQERHGRLIIYWKAETALPIRVERAIADAIALAEARAACSCTVCGASARLFSDAGQLLTACTKHARGIPVRVRPGAENLHIVRTFVGDGVGGVIGCQRYDRVHDRFTDSDLIGADDWHEIRSRGKSKIPRTDNKD